MHGLSCPSYVQRYSVELATSICDKGKNLRMGQPASHRQVDSSLAIACYCVSLFLTTPLPEMLWRSNGSEARKEPAQMQADRTDAAGELLQQSRSIQ